MKSSLSLQIGHQLVMTPQLQHAIKLLQLSTLDLKNEVNIIAERNPFLDVIEAESEVESSLYTASESESIL